MGNIFSELIYRPIISVTVFLYGVLPFHDLGIAIILITIAIRLLFLPLSLKTARSQKMMADLAPEIERVKQQHPEKAAQSEAVMKLYKERGVNPLAGCLPLLLQLPILIGMYRVFLDIFKPESLSKLYAFVPNPGTVNHFFLGLMDISVPSPAFAILAGILQFFQAKIAAGNQPQTGPSASLNKQMAYLFPVMIIIISWNLPAGLALYWIVTTLFSIGEQLYLKRR